MRSSDRRSRLFGAALLLAALALVACRSRSAAAPDAGGPSGAAIAPRREGEVQPTSFGSAELVLRGGTRFLVYLADRAGAPLSPRGAEGSVRVALSGYPEVALRPGEDALEGEGPALPADRPTLVLVLRRGEQAEAIRYPARSELRAPGAPPRQRAAGLDELRGTITDSTCLLRGEGAGEDHRECALRCIHGGAAIAIVERGTGKIYVALAPPGQSVKDLLLPYVGSELLVRGSRRVQGGSQFFEIQEVYPPHDHSPLEGGAVGMAGDLHLEVLALRSGEVRVYLSDDYRNAVSPAGQGGSVEVKDAKGALRAAALLPDPAGRFLAAQVGPLAAGAVELTARLKLGELGERFHVPGAAEPEGFFMTFMVDPLEAVGAPPTRPEGKAGSPLIVVQGGYSPDVIKLKKGQPARLRFLRKDSGECSRELVIPELGVRQELASMAETVVAVTPERAGTFEFRCGMNMLHGTLVVED